jgi:hypothetical protein
MNKQFYLCENEIHFMTMFVNDVMGTLVCVLTLCRLLKKMTAVTLL